MARRIAWPIVLPKGRALELVYGIALWDGTLEAAQIEQAYLQWVKLATGDRSR